jgi:hypothetical protein
VKKINANAYQLKLPSHIKTADVFTIKHLVPFCDYSSEQDANSRANSLQPWEDDADRDAGEYMRKNGRDMEVEPPRRMMTRSQTKGPDDLRSFAEDVSRGLKLLSKRTIRA